MNSTSVSTSFPTERRTSSGSAFHRGGADAASRRARLAATRSPGSRARRVLWRGACSPPRRGRLSRRFGAGRRAASPSSAMFHGHKSGANANGGHGPLTVTTDRKTGERRPVPPDIAALNQVVEGRGVPRAGFDAVRRPRVRDRARRRRASGQLARAAAARRRLEIGGAGVADCPSGTAGADRGGACAREILIVIWTRPRTRSSASSIAFAANRNDGRVPRAHDAPNRAGSSVVHRRRDPHDDLVLRPQRRFRERRHAQQCARPRQQRRCSR